jgi:hypothetical protein
MIRIHSTDVLNYNSHIQQRRATVKHVHVHTSTLSYLENWIINSHVKSTWIILVLYISCFFMHKKRLTIGWEVLYVPMTTLHSCTMLHPCTSFMQWAYYIMYKIYYLSVNIIIYNHFTYIHIIKNNKITIIIIGCVLQCRFDESGTTRNQCVYSIPIL